MVEEKPNSSGVGLAGDPLSTRGKKKGVVGKRKFKLKKKLLVNQGTGGGPGEPASKKKNGKMTAASDLGKKKKKTALKLNGTAAVQGQEGQEEKRATLKKKLTRKGKA